MKPRIQVKIYSLFFSDRRVDPNVVQDAVDLLLREGKLKFGMPFEFVECFDDYVTKDDSGNDLYMMFNISSEDITNAVIKDILSVVGHRISILLLANPNKYFLGNLA